MRSTALVLAISAVAACKSGSKAAPEPGPVSWERDCHQFVMKLAAAFDREPEDCDKLAVELAKLEPDARALHARLEKAGRSMLDFEPDFDLKQRFYMREHSPLVTCAGNPRFDSALQHSYFEATGEREAL